MANEQGKAHDENWCVMHRIVASRGAANEGTHENILEKCFSEGDSPVIHA